MTFSIGFMSLSSLFAKIMKNFLYNAEGTVSKDIYHVKSVN